MDTKLFARIGAIAFVAIAITMTAIQMRTAPTPAAEPPAASLSEPERDPLRDELIRCQSIGGAGATDAACLRAWAENRRRFLAPGARPTERLPVPASATALTLATGDR